MRSYLDCLPCFLRQILQATRQVTADETIQREVLDRAAALLPNLPLDATPIELGRRLHGTVRDVTGVSDPYHKAKKRDNDRVLSLVPSLRDAIESSVDPLRTALWFAARGNAIDLGIRPHVNSHRVFGPQAQGDDGLRDYARFRSQLDHVDEVLYIGDNAGEIVADRLAVEQLIRLGKAVTFVVRGRPIINDVTEEDATYIGMDRIADVISSGSDGPGTALSLCHPAFVDHFRDAPLILAKGQGNFEGLSDEQIPVFFLLQVKCTVVERELGVDIGKHVLVCSSARSCKGIGDAATA